MKAEIVSIGTELLLGQVTDTNATHIARRLADLGISLERTAAVGDNVERIVQALAAALARADLVITTGGLGPTVDDVTRDAVALVTRRPLRRHADLERSIRERIEAHGVRFTDNNRRQAQIPSGATVIPNPVGTAPGFVAPARRGRILCLPGVPGEMIYLMDRWVTPYLARLDGRASAHIASVELNVVGMSESGVDEALADLMRMGPNPTVGVLCFSGVIQVRVTARGRDRAAALALARPVVAIIRRRLGRRVFAAGKDLSAVVLELLKRSGQRLAIAERGTGGALARRLLPAGRPSRAVVLCCALGEGAWAGHAGTRTQPRDVAGMARWVRSIARTPVALAADVRRRGTGGTLEICLILGKRRIQDAWTWKRALTDLDGRLAHRALDTLRRALLDP